MQFPKFGYQVCSSETAGLGDVLQDNTKSAGRTITSGSKSLKKKRRDKKQGRQEYAASNFAKEDESIVEHRVDDVAAKVSSDLDA